MKSAKKIVALLLIMVLVVSCVAISAVAETSYDEWSEYYETCDNTKITLTPGTDETELNFSWHSEYGWTIAKPVVRISKNADMKDYKEFEGYYTFSEYANQRVNNVTATGIEANTTYYYTYGVDGDFSEPVKYQTHAFDGFKFLYISDAQPNYKSNLTLESYSWNKSLETAFTNNDDISFIVNAGDITNSGKANDEWNAFLAPSYLRSYPMAATQGNHDKKHTTYKYYFNNPNVYPGLTPTVYGNGYWFTYGDVLFVMINSIKYNQYDSYGLVKEAVEANPDAKWRVAVMHYDLYGTGKHVGDEETEYARKTLAPILDEFDFDIALTGHEHTYGRSYFMDGGEILTTPGYENGVVTDPEGIMYVTASGSKGNTRLVKDDVKERINFDHLGFRRETVDGDDCYSTIEITKDGKLTLKTYDVGKDGEDAGKLVDEFTIVKTNYEFEEKGTTGGYLGVILKPLMGEYFIIFEMFNDLFEAVADAFSKIIESVKK